MTDRIRHVLSRLTAFRAARRPSGRRSRTGSVLILVVALLVLMALIGTAWISTTRTDRYAAVQHSFNTEIELLVEGVVRMAQAALGNDFFEGGTAYRPASAPAVTGVAPDPAKYRHRDSASERMYLADRVPTTPDWMKPPSAGVVGPSGNPPIWKNLSYPLTGLAGGGAPRFDMPNDKPPLPLAGLPGLSGSPVKPGTELPVTPPEGRKWNYFFAPTSIAFNGRADWPALDVYYVDWVTGTVGQVTRKGSPPYDGPIPAADVDGDGIADAGLWKLPVGEINGVTYFAAARILDNGSALNASTAWKPNTEFTAAPGFPGNFFTSNIDLKGSLFWGPARRASVRAFETDKLNWYRFGDYAAGKPFRAGYYENPSGTAITTPVEDNLSKPTNPGTPRGDYAFISIYDEFSNQLARRLDWEGQYVPGQTFRSLPTSDAAKLAYKFVLYNAEDTSPTGIEQWLDGSMRPAPTQLSQGEPFNASDALTWFDKNFNYPAMGRNINDVFSRRALMTTRNPVANLAPSHDFAAIPVEAKAPGLNPGDPPPTSPTLSKEWAGMVGTQKMPAKDILPLAVPAGSPPQSPRPVRKASVNTADFGELWRAFWMVMHRPDGPGGAVAGNAPFPATDAKAPTKIDQLLDRANSGVAVTAPQARRMFRSPIRDPRRTTAQNVPPSPLPIPDLTPSAMLMLRSALAAVNAMDIRDPDDDVTSRRFLTTTGAGAGAVTYEVTVFGTERQPYITEVYVNNNNSTAPDAAEFPTGSNPKGYVAIELHNPYPEPILLTNWTMAIVDRRAAPTPPRPGDPPPVPGAPTGAPVDPYPSMKFKAIPFFAGFPAGTVIPANGYLLVDNYIGTAGVDPTPGYGAKSRPTSVFPIAPATPPISAPGLYEVLFDTDMPTESPGGELVLLRPRRADGVLIPRHSSSRPASKVFVGEGLTAPEELVEMVPVDAMDFYGCRLESALPTAPPPIYNAWHYVRRNGPTNAWRFVYPGRWDPTHPWDPAKPQRQQGLQEFPLTDPTTGTSIIPTYNPPVGLGMADLLSTYDATSIPPGYNPIVPIQLNNYGFGGPNKPPVSGKNAFPFGAFARNGDLLQVPYIGAYRIRAVNAMGEPVSKPVTGSSSEPVGYMGQFIEMNPVTMDCAFADDYDQTNALTESIEQIGRFIPLISMLPPGMNLPPGTNDTYAWAADLFDYLTVQSPADDYGPDVAPDAYHKDHGTTGSNPTGGKAANSPDFDLTNGSPYGYNKTPGAALPPPAAIRNTPSTQLPNQGNENLVPVDGLININTAPWRVLAALPMVTDPSGAIIPDQNAELARAIVDYRDGKPLPDPKVAPPHGPFQTIFDLNKVPGFATGGTGSGKIAPSHADLATIDPNRNQGDLSGGTAGAGDGVIGDYEARFLMMNRISNLVTTRSDSYTVYLLVQGWRGVGTASPELVVQRRRAFLADRSGVTPQSRDVPAQFFYND